MHASLAKMVTEAARGVETRARKRRRDLDAQAGVAGVEIDRNRWYLAGTIARTRNHETNNEAKYIDATGWEVYSRYSINPRFRVVGGYNWLDPDDDDPNAGAFDIRSFIAGVQWTYSALDFGDIVYFEMEIDSGHNVDGSRRDNIYTIGFRFSVEL